MLRGMGWTGGLEVEKDELKNQFGSSRNEKGNKNVVVIESLIKPRLRLLGLGADTFANVLIQNNIITSSGRKDQEETRFKKKDQYDEGIRNNDAGFRGSNQNLNRKDRDDPAVKLETTNSRHDALSDSKRINIQSQVHIILGRHQGMRGSVINICQKEKGTVVSVEGTDKNNQKVVARVWIEDLRVVQ